MKKKHRIKQLESEVAELRAQVAGMKQAIELLKHHDSPPPQPNPFWQVNPTTLPNPLLPPYLVQNDPLTPVFTVMGKVNSNPVELKSEWDFDE